MYIPVWLLVLIFLPAACGLAILLGAYAIIGLAILWEQLTAGVTAVARIIVLPLRWLPLRQLASPFRHLGPWFDYAITGGLLAAMLCGALLYLASLQG